MLNVKPIFGNGNSLKITEKNDSGYHVYWKKVKWDDCKRNDERDRKRRNGIKQETVNSDNTRLVESNNDVRKQKQATSPSKLLKQNKLINTQQVFKWHDFDTTPIGLSGDFNIDLKCTRGQ